MAGFPNRKGSCSLKSHPPSFFLTMFVVVVFFMTKGRSVSYSYGGNIQSQSLKKRKRTITTWVSVASDDNIILTKVVAKISVLCKLTSYRRLLNCMKNVYN